ncbi:PoNe immunity protein domain-containing protein [Hymenobacter fodinae]|uniref:DUF1911 domain-containing protein n=1 Tax=Hymenobacter fodinae TaxID=2510796 RepID=A0A4Z0P6Y0_9BACT|nr:PoNe immunity protein domain-containing protein [Hymenobacter fodinae]TGE07770.1 DUF1911 domain-containing protein [Hymenobacter fodinae]
MQREQHKDISYFDERIESRLNEVTKREIGVASNPSQYAKLDSVYANIFYLSVDILQGRYSRGDALAELATDFPDLIRKWEQYLNHPAHEPFEFAAPITADVRYLDNYTDALRMLAWAYLFDLEEALWLRLVACISNVGQDALIERLILRRLPWLANQRPPTTQLVYPKAYQPLYDAIDAVPVEQPILVQRFLQGWYKNLKKVSWHDTHKQGSFFGYWAWEAAAVTLAFGLDDTNYNTMPHYPSDAVNFARTL